MYNESMSKAKISLVYIDEEYTDFLRTVDKRVPYNINRTYQRPFTGILFKVQNMEYFAPLTTSSKGKKLMQNPKQESITFLPIENCRFGGVNFNNMIPVVAGVYTYINLTIAPNDDEKARREKIKYMRILRFLRKNHDKIIVKAKKIYNLQRSGELYENYMKVTCDFAILEKQCMLWFSV